MNLKDQILIWPVYCIQINIVGVSQRVAGFISKLSHFNAICSFIIASGSDKRTLKSYKHAIQLVSKVKPMTSLIIVFSLYWP